MIFTALFDANVLYSVPVTDLCMEVSCSGLFRALWSEEIHDEWVRNVIIDRPDTPEMYIGNLRSCRLPLIASALENAKSLI